MTTNHAIQRVAFGVFFAVLAFVGWVMLTGEPSNADDEWHYLGPTHILGFAPADLRPGHSPRLDSALLADANVVGRAMGTPFVAIDSYHVHMRPRGDTVPPHVGDALIYVVRDARGARSTFSVNARRGGSEYRGLYVHRDLLRQRRAAATAPPTVSLEPACVHAADAPVGSCRLVRASAARPWECQCTTVGTLVP